MSQAHCDISRNINLGMGQFQGQGMCSFWTHLGKKQQQDIQVEVASV